jgi:hypothetical protein
MPNEHRSIPRRRRLALSILLGAAIACGHFSSDVGADSRPLIFFTNESLDQADVYAVVPGTQALRIGTVMPGRTDTLSVPATIMAGAGNVEIVARILARNYAPRTGPVSINPGDRLEVRLPSDEKTLIVLPGGP